MSFSSSPLSFKALDNKQGVRAFWPKRPKLGYEAGPSLWFLNSVGNSVFASPTSHRRQNGCIYLQIVENRMLHRWAMQISGHWLPVGNSSRRESWVVGHCERLNGTLPTS